MKLAVCLQESRLTGCVAGDKPGTTDGIELPQPIDVDAAGGVVGRGLVAFDSGELPALLGRSTRDLARQLGPAYAREVVHRDDLVVLRRSPVG